MFLSLLFSWLLSSFCHVILPLLPRRPILTAHHRPVYSFLLVLGILLDSPGFLFSFFLPSFFPPYGVHVISIRAWRGGI